MGVYFFGKSLYFLSIINFTNIINFIMDIMGRGLVDRDQWL